MSDKPRKGFRYRLSRLIGAPGRHWYVRFSAQLANRNQRIEFPKDLSNASRFLCVASDTVLDAIHEVDAVNSIAAAHDGARVDVLCESSCAPLFANVGGLSEVFAYNRSECFLFSDSMRRIRRNVRREQYDACVLLNPDPDDAVLLLITSSGIKLRVGLGGGARYPVTNIEYNPSRDATHIDDRCLGMLRVLGVNKRYGAKWTVAREAMDEIGHLMREFGVDPKVAPHLVDTGHFYREFGPEWTSGLLQSLTSNEKQVWFHFSLRPIEGEFLRWLGQHNLPCFSDLSLSRAAAVVKKSAVVVTGRAVSFELARMLGRPSVGIFQEKELGTYFKSRASSMGLTFVERPDEETIRKATKAVESVG